MADSASKTIIPKMTELPLEILIEILLLLPVKPLIRFKCVSKSWKTLISSPKFTKNHLKQTLITNPNYQTLIISQNKSLFTADITNPNIIRFIELNHPFKGTFGNSDVYLLASYHGIILLCDYPKKNICLYNPATNSYRLLPSPAPACFKELYDLNEFYGFGYDGLSDDYKVVRLLQWLDDGGYPCRTASVYSLRDDVWKMAKYEKLDEIRFYYLPREQGGLTAMEMLYFIGMPRDFRPVLKCFDFRTEEFLNVDFPELESYDVSKTIMSLREIEGCLWLIVTYQQRKGMSFFDSLNSRENRQFQYADVWEMRERGKKESWVKLFRIRKGDIVERCASVKFITYSKDKKSVLVLLSGMWYGWYHLVTKKLERLEVQGWQCGDSPYGSQTIVDSLVSVSNDTLGSKGVAVANKKTTKKNDFLSSGFKLRL